MQADKKQDAAHYARSPRRKEIQHKPDVPVPACLKLAARPKQMHQRIGNCVFLFSRNAGHCPFVNRPYVIGMGG